VLVVEDDGKVATAFGRFLLRAGYEVIIKRTAVDALSEVTATPPDVVLSDIGLPDFSGVQLLAIIKDVCPELPVILITGNPQVESAVAAVEHGAVDYLLKPSTPQALLSAVHRALTLGRLAAARRESASLPPSEGQLANIELAFEQALDALFVVYQPIVASAEPQIVGYEALARTRERSFANTPEVLAAAEQLGRVHETRAPHS
jgi:DNA-binding NtrC family response regulator